MSYLYVEGIGRDYGIEDEIYHVVQGEGRFCIENEDFEVQQGSIIYVPAHAAHKFHSITQDLTILVVFSCRVFTTRISLRSV
ncbi:cupin domain-containing protein [Paenibacillus mendelii]|uniref:Cupin domain-containing protein n=1 Tax=Paenibacillus mendelii TaxID=206163 RepID=A0ABV6JES5_9BACL